MMSQTLPKRFYAQATSVEMEEGWGVLLDGRAVKTPARRLLLLPNLALAEMIVDEFNLVSEVINPAHMPLTRIANTVIDGIADNPSSVAEDIVRFISADMIFYRASEPEELVARQRAAWDPLLDFASTKWGCHFELGEGVLPLTQPRASMQAISHHLNQISSPFMLASLHVMTSLTGSGLIALAVGEGIISVQKAWEIAHLDEDWTNEHWGEDIQAMERRRYRQNEFDAAAAIMATFSTPLA